MSKLSELKNFILRKAPPGPPPRPDLEWHEETRRWRKRREEETKPVKVDKPIEPTAKLSGKQWVDSMSPMEKHCIAYWQGSGYTFIRPCQAGMGKSFCKPDVRKAIDEIEKTLNRAIPFEGEVFRGLHGLNRAELAKMKTAETLELNALSSSSKDINIASRFIREGGNNVMLKIRNKTGVDLTPTGLGGEEQEVLLRNKTKYKIIEKNERTYQGPVGEVKALELVLEEI